LRNIYKTFPSNGAKALEGASLELRCGEIHAVFGENGAGKSTLMQILAGFQRPDSGEIVVDGKIRRFSSTRDALSFGIGMVRQRPELCPGLRVWEACVLGAEARRGPFLRRAASRESVSRLSREWGFDLPADAPVETLDAAGRQRAAVLAALLRKIRFIIFDEPTAVLNRQESEKFYALFRRLSESGVSPVIVSHKIDETLLLANRATVLRKGVTAAALNSDEFDSPKIIALMFGGDHSETASKPSARRLSPSAKARLEIVGLSAERTDGPSIRSVNMELRGGMIYGLAGVRESGVETLLLAVAGFLRLSSGSVSIDGSAVKGIRRFRESGGVYLGMGSGSAAAWDRALSISDNLVIHAYRRFTRPVRALARAEWLDSRSLREWTISLARGAGVKYSPSVKAWALSGGMLQSLLAARELAENAAVILMSEPGWGLDTRRRRSLFSLLRSEADTGKTALLFLSDLNDLLEVSDEVFVMCGGSVSLHLRQEELLNADVSAVKSRINGAIAGISGTAAGTNDGGA
jgi:simple sugar transport system ATP-binding protein